VLGFYGLALSEIGTRRGRLLHRHGAHCRRDGFTATGDKYYIGNGRIWDQVAGLADAYEMKA